MKDIQGLIAKYTKDENVDFQAVEKEINDEINALIIKKTDEAKLETIKSFGVESKEELIKRLESVETLSKEKEDLSKTVEGARTQVTELERKASILRLGIQDPDDIDYLLFNVAKRVNEETDWDKALNAYKEEKPQMFSKPSITTNVRHQGTDTPEKFGFEKILEEKHPEVFKK